MSQRVKRKRVIPLIYNKTTDTTTIKHVILIHDRMKNYQVFVETANSNTFPINDTYTYYHFYLENDEDDTQRFGVWANNLLVETPNKEYFTKHIENK